MRDRLTYAAALAMVTPVIGAQAHAATLAAKDDRAVTCAKIAELLSPEEDMKAQSQRSSDAMVVAMFSQNPNLIALDGKYPGLQQAIIPVMRPLVLESAQITLPLMRADIAHFYAANLTPAEARSYLQLLSTPEMRAFTRATGRDTNAEKMSEELVDSKGFKISGQQVAELSRNAGIKAVSQSSTQLRVTLIRFMQTSAGRKIAALGPQKSAIVAKWVSYAPPGLSDKVERATVAAMISHVAKTDPAAAERMRAGFAAKQTQPAPTESPKP